MSCQTRPGPQVFVRAIESATGHTISQQQWHVMKEMAFSDAAYERSQELKYETNIAHRQAAAHDYAREVTGRSRVTPQEAVDAAEALRARLKKDEGNFSSDVEPVTEEMVKQARETKMTASTVAIAKLMARKGVRNALRQADHKILEKKRNLAAKKRVLAAADAAEADGDSKMAEGLRKAASHMDANGDGRVADWYRGADPNNRYPGFWGRYQELTRGSKEARKFSMFSYEGNEAALSAANSMTDDMRKAAASGDKWTPEQVREKVEWSLGSLSKDFPEVFDTEPRTEFWGRVGDTARELGWLDHHEGYWQYN